MDEGTLFPSIPVKRPNNEDAGCPLHTRFDPYRDEPLFMGSICEKAVYMKRTTPTILLRTQLKGQLLDRESNEGNKSRTRH